MKLRPFQADDVKTLIAHDLHAIVASGMGTGKTPIAISALTQHPNALPAVVVCTVSLTKNWLREFRAWAPHVTCRVVTREDEKLGVLTANTVILVPWNLLSAQQHRIARSNVRSIVADECHLAKNPESQRGRALAFLRDRVERVMQMTGTPVVNVRGDLQVLRSYAKKKPIIIRRYLEEAAPDVPPKTRAYVYVQLRKTYRAEYDQALEDFADWYKDYRSELVEEGQSEVQVQQALAAEALAKVGHLRRLVGQFKVPAAIDWISRAVRLGEPVVVFLEHQLVLRKLVKGLRKQRIRHVVLDGNSTEDQRDDAVVRFQQNDVPVFIGTRAAKEGLTLTAARHLLFLERYWTSADEEQAEDRIRRIGQVHPTRIWFLHAQGTIDDRIDEIIHEKRAIVRAQIGSMPVGESSTRNVVRLLASWSTDAATTPQKPPSALGLGKLPDPLPSPNETHALVFRGSRWSTGSMLTWCKMHGYAAKPDSVYALRAVVHPMTAFRTGSFRQVPVAKDIFALIGERVR
jgi:SNF2 family DNA or RNA helicase